MQTVKVFLTIDTEHSIGGAFNNPDYRPIGNKKRIFGKIGKRYYGIPLLIDIANEFGLPLTFFVETFNKHYFGLDQIKETCDYVLKRGHDIQLHLHPNYLNFKLSNYIPPKYSDLIGEYSTEDQIKIISEAKDDLKNIAGYPPIAFRAGCFGANDETLEVLSKLGFIIDSSYNQSFLPKPCLMSNRNLNTVAYLNGVYEFPVTNFYETSRLRPPRYMPLDLNGVSFEEIRFLLEHFGRTLKAVTIILHSFSFIKAFGVQYKKIRPRFEIIRRFRRLCKFLAENNHKYHVLALGSLDQESLSDLVLNERRHIFPTVPWRLTFLRLGEQLFDKLPI